MLCETSLSRASLFRLLIIFGISRLWALGIGGRSLPYIEDAYREIDNEIWKHVEGVADNNPRVMKTTAYTRKRDESREFYLKVSCTDCPILLFTCLLLLSL